MASAKPWRVALAVCISIPPLWIGLRSSSTSSAASTANRHLVSHLLQGGPLTAADVARLSANANQRVIVLMKNQHPELPNTHAAQATRSARSLEPTSWPIVPTALVEARKACHTPWLV